MTDTPTPADPLAEIRQGFAETKARIEADRTLSDEGKAELLASARERTNGKIEALRAEADAAVTAERASLETQLLAPPRAPYGSTQTELIARDASYRDALGRAEMTSSPADLLNLQRTALLVGDHLLARATMVVGLQRGEVDVVNAWSAANPRLEAEVDRLWEMTHTPPSVRKQIATAMAFGPV